MNLTSRTCEVCSRNWIEHEDGWHDCPQCNPGQPKPLAVRRVDPLEHFGPGWYWNETVGAFGRWDPLEGKAVIAIELLHELGACLAEEPLADRGIIITAAACLEIRRLRTRIRQLFERPAIERIVEEAAGRSLPSVCVFEDGTITGDELLRRVMSAVRAELARAEDLTAVEARADGKAPC